MPEALQTLAMGRAAHPPIRWFPVVFGVEIGFVAFPVGALRDPRLPSRNRFAVKAANTNLCLPELGGKVKLSRVRLHHARPKPRKDSRLGKTVLHCVVSSLAIVQFALLRQFSISRFRQHKDNKNPHNE
mgnify:CR=1 FL=1